MNHAIRFEDIARTTADAARLTLADIKGRSRKRSVARPRQVAMALCRRITGRSLPEIGAWFGRDHTTVIHAVGAVSRLERDDPGFRAAVDAIAAAVIDRSHARGRWDRLILAVDAIERFCRALGSAADGKDTAPREHAPDYSTIVAMGLAVSGIETFCLAIARHRRDRETRMADFVRAGSPLPLARARTARGGPDPVPGAFSAGAAP